MKFSARTPEDLTNNILTQELEETKHPIWDLTQSNPTQCEFDYPQDLFRGLSNPEALSYIPASLGLSKAREILANYLSSRGQKIQWDQLVLTASTSEAYSYLFKLLGNPGDQFMVPSPGYPLLDHLLRLEALNLVPYHLQKKINWPIDINSIQKGLNDKTRGLITVNPHNPTGTYLSIADQEVLLHLCAKKSIAYISDEVFGDFSYQTKTSMIENEDVLSFRLGGFSKSLGLPQLKLSWIAIQGPRKDVIECKNRLELIADTYLSVNTPVQCAIQDLLAFAPNIQGQIHSRISQNRQQLEMTLRGLPLINLWPAQGGWYALIEVSKDGLSDQDLALELLKTYQVLVQPGWLYDFHQGCFLVLSLLPPSDYFLTGLNRLRQFLEKLS